MSTLDANSIRHYCKAPCAHGRCSPWAGLPLVDPFDEAQVQPASYDFRLGRRFATFQLKQGMTKFTHDVRLTPEGPVDVWSQRPLFLDLANAESELGIFEVEADSYVLLPGGFVLAQTQEFFNFPSFLAGEVRTKSSLGRLGLAVSNGDACWFDPGFRGVGVLELKNNGPVPLLLKEGMKVGQMIFRYVIDDGKDQAYDGNYQVQTDLNLGKWVKALVKVGTNIRRVPAAILAN